MTLAARWLAEVDALATKATHVMAWSRVTESLDLYHAHVVPLSHADKAYIAALSPERVRQMVAACNALAEYVAASDDCVSPTDANGETAAMLRFGNADDKARAALAALDGHAITWED